MKRRRRPVKMDPEHAAIVTEWRALWRSGTPDDVEEWWKRHGALMNRMWEARLSPATVAEWAGPDPRAGEGPW
ncbi:hypothetical protein AB0302_08625 [Micrococcus sp. NPDC078436]|uniref:hypothetical protein n=1 Tax=Micrococcus sp. NPDC078436 TaxID=3154960 RepID=UPI00344EA937